MDFLKIAILTTALIIFSCSAIAAEDKINKRPDCFEKCMETHKEDRKKGELLCAEPLTGVEDGRMADRRPMSKCEFECTGEQPAEDINGCFAEFCKTIVWKHIGLFCTAYGENLVYQPEECDTMVGTGKVKLLGREVCYGEKS